MKNRTFDGKVYSLYAKSKDQDEILDAIYKARKEGLLTKGTKESGMFYLWTKRQDSIRYT